MSPSAEPPFDPEKQGISLDELAQAFAQVMGVEPQASGTTSESDPSSISAEGGTDDVSTVDTSAAFVESAGASTESSDADDGCPISPRSILEAMLFVGNRDNRPLTPARVAELMRGVTVEDIPPLVDELNAAYEAQQAAYHIIGEGDGYRLALRPEMRHVQDRFFGRVREARLSQASIDVLALVAYQQPITGEQVNKQRGKPSNHLLAHLVRRGILRIERSQQSPRLPHYRTTDRFLKLFNLESLADLPHSEDGEPQ